MKNILLIILLLAIRLNTYGQGTGIGTLAPHPSAILDIQSASKGVLFPNIPLTGKTDNTSISLPAVGLLLFNTNSGMYNRKGLYYNGNTAQAPVWHSVADWHVPFSTVATIAGTAFQIDTYQGSTGATAIKGYSVSNGVGIRAESELGTALDVNGKVRIAGNGHAPGVGKVLTTDASGNATWDGAIGFLATGVKGGGSEKMAQSATKIPFATEEYDLQGNYIDANTSPHSTFTAPVKGVYNFDVQVGYIGPVQYGLMETFLMLYRKRNNVETLMGMQRQYSGEYNSASLNMELLLEPGDQVYVKFAHTATDYIDLFTANDYCHFSGVLVTKL